MKIERQNAVKVENFAVPVWLFAPKTQLNVRMSGLTPDHCSNTPLGSNAPTKEGYLNLGGYLNCYLLCYFEI